MSTVPCSRTTSYSSPVADGGEREAGRRGASARWSVPPPVSSGAASKSEMRTIIGLALSGKMQDARAMPARICAAARRRPPVRPRLHGLRGVDKPVPGQQRQRGRQLAVDRDRCDGQGDRRLPRGGRRAAAEHARARTGRSARACRSTTCPAGPPFIATNAASASAIVSAGERRRELIGCTCDCGGQRRADGEHDDLARPASMSSRPPSRIDGAGNAIAVWGANIGGVNRIFLRFKNATTGTLGRGRPRCRRTTGNNQEPRIAVEPGGRAYMVWRDFQVGGQVVMGHARSTAGTLSVAAPALGANGVTGSADVAIDTAGTALVAWTKELDFTRCRRARAARAATLSPVTTLSSAGSAADYRGRGDGRRSGTDRRRRLAAAARRRCAHADPADRRRDLADDGDRVAERARRERAARRHADGRDHGHEPVLDQRGRRRARADPGTGPARRRAASRRWTMVSSANGLPAQNPRLAINAAGRAGGNRAPTAAGRRARRPDLGRRRTSSGRGVAAPRPDR